MVDVIFSISYIMLWSLKHDISQIFSCHFLSWKCLLFTSAAYIQKHFRLHFDHGSKHCEPWSDCSYGSSLILVHIVCNIDHQSTQQIESRRHIVNGGKMVKIASSQNFHCNKIIQSTWFSADRKHTTYVGQGTKIFKYCTCPAGWVTTNFHSSCKHMQLSFKSVCNKEHKSTSSSNPFQKHSSCKALVPQDKCFGKNYSSLLDFTCNYERMNGIFVPCWERVKRALSQIFHGNKILQSTG